MAAKTIIVVYCTRKGGVVQGVVFMEFFIHTPPLKFRMMRERGDMTIDDLCAKMGAMYAQLSRLEQGERGGVRRSLVQHMLEDSAVMRYIIGRLSPEQRREADKFLSNHAEYIAGNTMDEKVSGLEERKYKIRIWEKVTETK